MFKHRAVHGRTIVGGSLRSWVTTMFRRYVLPDDPTQYVITTPEGGVVTPEPRKRRFSRSQRAWGKR